MFLKMKIITRMGGYMNFKKRTLAVLINCFCLTGVYAETAESSQTASKRSVEKHYQIPANQLGYVLSHFAAQSGVTLSYDAKLLKGYKSNGLNGEYSVDSGFHHLLKDSPYRVVKQGSVYTLVEKSAAPAAVDGTFASPTSSDIQAAPLVQLEKITATAEKSKLKPNVIERTAEEIQRFRGTGNGDVFTDMVGVQLNSMRNEAGAVDIGIRGIQGEGRVPIVIDGSLQSTHTFRGYQGESDRSYIDMDLISQIEVEKGASKSKFGVGGVGGLVKMRTISTGDILLPNRQFGLLLKGSFYNNNKTPNIPEDEVGQQRFLLEDKLSTTDFQNGAGTAALAYKNDLVDVVAAYSKRRVGNYFAGTQGKERFGKKSRSAIVSPGQEVVNTSYESESSIIKAGINITDAQRIEANYRRHNQAAGEVMAAYWYKARHRNPNSGTVYSWYAPDGIDSMAQWSLGTAKVNTFSSNYTFKPHDNPLIDLSVGLWKTSAKMHQHNGIASGFGNFGDQYWGSYRDDRSGVNLENRSQFSTIPLSLNYGLTFDKQRMKPLNYYKRETSANALRKENSVFINGEYDISKFTLGLGSRWHKAQVEDYLDPVEKMRDYEGKFDWIGQLNYELIPGIDLYTKASSTYRQPSLFESTTSGQTFRYERNFPITAENARLGEVGIIGHLENLWVPTDQLNFSLNYYRNQTKDFLTQGVKKGRLTFINYDQVVLKGLEAEFSYANPSFFVSLGGAVNEAPKVCPYKENKCNEVGDFWSLVSVRLPPRKTMYFTAGKYFLDQKINIGTRVKYHTQKKNPRGWLKGTGVGARAVLDIPATTVVDLFAKYTVNPNLAFSLNVDNLTNRYSFDPGAVIGMPIPGRTVRAGVEMKF